MFLIVGLGNPGAKYEGHRHNVGFMAVDELHRNYGFGNWSAKEKALVSKGQIKGQACLLVKPQTFMNCSGESVQPLANFFKVPSEKILVIHDELDLPTCKVKIKIGGGHGGHNGLKSIQQRLGTPNFKRVRIGVDHPGHKDRVSGYVLSDFSKKERLDIAMIMTHLVDALPHILAGDDARVMNDLARVMPL